MDIYRTKLGFKENLSEAEEELKTALRTEDYFLEKQAEYETFCHFAKLKIKDPKISEVEKKILYR